MDFLADASAARRLCYLLGFCLCSHANVSVAEFHGTLSATTNNAERWFSKTNGGLAIQANVDYEHQSGFYLGSSVSNVAFEKQAKADAAEVEIIPYAGWTWALSGRWRLDLQWSRYLYDGQVFGHTADYNEFYIFLHYRDLISIHVSGAEDYYGVDHYALNYALIGRYPITDALQFTATFGYAQTQVALGADYPYWHMGFNYAYKMFTFSARYMDSAEIFIQPDDNQDRHALYDPAVLDVAGVFSISAGF